MNKYIFVCCLIGLFAVSQAQLYGLARLLAGPRGGMLKLLAQQLPLLQKGLATLQDMRAARTLGCRPPFDNESPFRAFMPSGCTSKKDVCPYTKPLTKCLQVGLVGMCCPYFVSSNTIRHAKMIAKWRKLRESLA